MGLDIKIPIGLLFTVIGILLSVYGFITYGNTVLYEKSLGININLWSGLLMLVFGIFMLIFSKWKRPE